MDISPGRIAANLANASRGDDDDHVLDTPGLARAIAEADEIADLARKFFEEMRPLTEVGGLLVDRMALYAVRMKRCSREELVRLAAMNDGEGGLLDLSPEGQFAHRYEQAAVRNFFKARDEFRKEQAAARDLGIAASPRPTSGYRPLASSCAATPPPRTGPEPGPRATEADAPSRREWPVAEAHNPPRSPDHIPEVMSTDRWDIPDADI